MICSKITLSVKTEFVLIPLSTKKGKYYQDEVMNKTAIPLKPKISAVRQFSSILCKINHFHFSKRIFQKHCGLKFCLCTYPIWAQSITKMEESCSAWASEEDVLLLGFLKPSYAAPEIKFDRRTFSHCQFFRQTLNAYINIGRWTFQLTVTINLT
jgi:hypothetical protein